MRIFAASFDLSLFVVASSFIQNPGPYLPRWILAVFANSSNLWQIQRVREERGSSQGLKLGITTSIVAEPGPGLLG